MSRSSFVRAFRAIAVASLAAFVAACECSKCVKEPPCRPCENPCCLTPIQKTALGKGTHAIGSGPVAYYYEEKTYILFTEKGLKEFEKNPSEFAEKGAIRLIRGGQTWRVDVNPGDDVDLVAIANHAVPYSPPPKS